MTLGDKIRLARESSGLTMEELGKRCGTTKQTIYKYETGKITNIPLDRLEQIASAVGVSAASLMGWENKSEHLANEKQPTQLGELSDSEKHLIQLLRQLPKETQESYPALLEAALKAQGLL